MPGIRFGSNRYVGPLISAAALAVILTGTSYQAGYDQQAREATGEYSRYAEQQVGEACRGVVSVELVHCFAEARMAAKLKEYEYKRSQDDLVAQRTAALWTGIMGCAAVFGFFLSVAGVYLVWTTFKETRKANLIALSERAPSVHVEHISFEERGNDIAVEIKVRNYGGGEAQGFKMRGITAFGPLPLPDNSPGFGPESNAPTKLPAGGVRFNNNSHSGLDEWRDKILEEKAALIVGIDLVYKDRFGGQYQDSFWFFSTGAKFIQRVVSDCPKWAQESGGGGEDDPKQGTLTL